MCLWHRVVQMMIDLLARLVFRSLAMACALALACIDCLGQSPITRPPEVRVPHDSLRNVDVPYGAPFDVRENGQPYWQQFVFDVPPSLGGPIREFGFRRRNYNLGESRSTFPAFDVDLEVWMGHSVLPPADLHVVRSRNPMTLQRVVAPRRFRFPSLAWRADGVYPCVHRVVLDRPFSFAPGQVGVIVVREANTTLPFSGAVGVTFDAVGPPQGGGPPWWQDIGMSCDQQGRPSLFHNFLFWDISGIGMHLILRMTPPMFMSVGGGNQIFFLGLSDQHFAGLRLPFDLTRLGAPSCFIHVSLEWQLPTVATYGASNGFAVAELSIPNDPRLLGTNLFVQGVHLDRFASPLGLSTSNGVRMRVIPKWETRLSTSMWRDAPFNATGPDAYENRLFGGAAIFLNPR